MSVLQHPEGGAAPAPLSSDESRNDEHPLGLVPHQIRGYLSNFRNLLIRGKSYDCCSACSRRVVKAYEDDGWDFVKKALNEADYVARISGLADVSSLV